MFQSLRSAALTIPVVVAAGYRASSFGNKGSSRFLGITLPGNGWRVMLAPVPRVAAGSKMLRIGGCRENAAGTWNDDARKTHRQSRALCRGSVGSEITAAHSQSRVAFPQARSRSSTAKDLAARMLGSSTSAHAAWIAPTSTASALIRPSLDQQNALEPKSQWEFTVLALWGNTEKFVED